MVVSNGVGEEVEDSDTFSVLVTPDFILFFFGLHL
jgi:hypothetical protein